MGFKAGDMLHRVFLVGHILIFAAPLYLVLVALGVISGGDLRGVWASVCDAWKYGEI